MERTTWTCPYCGHSAFLSIDEEMASCRTCGEWSLKADLEAEKGAVPPFPVSEETLREMGHGVWDDDTDSEGNPLEDEDGYLPE